MASIKKLTDRKFKITVSNGYRPNGKKICKAKTITVPDSVKPRGIPQYVAHEAEELERLVKSGFAEDRDTTFKTYATRWLERQVKYAPGTLASYRRMLEQVYPYIGAIKLGELQPMALENMLIELRKRTHQGKPIREATVQKYLTVVSAVLSDAKRNEILSKNPARMIDLPDTEHRQQFIPTDEQAQYFLNALSEEHILYHAFYVLAIYTGCRRGELCALRWSDFSFVDHYTWNLVVSRSRSVVPGKGVVEGLTKNGRSRSMTISYYAWSARCGTCTASRSARPGRTTEKSAPTCSPTPRESRCIPILLPSACGSSSRNWASPLLFICIPCAITLSPPCSTREWTSRPLRSWQATGTPHSWRGLTAIPR